MNACEGSGEIRPGADAEDFLMLFGSLWQIPPTPAGEAAREETSGTCLPRLGRRRRAGAGGRLFVRRRRNRRDTGIPQPPDWVWALNSGRTIGRCNLGLRRGVMDDDFRGY